MLGQMYSSKVMYNKSEVSTISTVRILIILTSFHQFTFSSLFSVLTLSFFFFSNSKKCLSSINFICRCENIFMIFLLRMFKHRIKPQEMQLYPIYFVMRLTVIIWKVARTILLLICRSLKI